MKKALIVSATVAFLIVSFLPSANAALVSVLWEGAIDSAVVDEVVINTPGTYDISLMVSGIQPEDEPVFELQFDLVAPTGCEFSPTDNSQLSYGPAVTNWIFKMGGALGLGQRNIYREFSAEFMGGNYPLQNGLLVAGISLTIPELAFVPGATNLLAFGNAQGNYAQYIDFADMGVTAVPIPPTVLLLGGGLVGLIGIGRRRMRRS